MVFNAIGSGSGGKLTLTILDNYAFFVIGKVDGALVVPTTTSTGTVSLELDQGEPFFMKLYGVSGSKSYELDYIVDPGDATTISVSMNRTVISVEGGVKTVVKVGTDNDTPGNPEIITQS